MVYLSAYIKCIPFLFALICQLCKTSENPHNSLYSNSQMDAHFGMKAPENIKKNSQAKHKRTNWL